MFTFVGFLIWENSFEEHNKTAAETDITQKETDALRQQSAQLRFSS